jgi:hypothetical protein
MGEGGGDVKLTPRHQFELESPLTREQALEAMLHKVGRLSLPRYTGMYSGIRPSASGGEPFYGSRKPDGFDIRPVGAMVFRPLTQITVGDRDNGSTITARLCLEFWATPLLVITGAIMLSALADPPHRTAITFTAGLVFAVLYTASMASFWSQAARQEAMLREIFKVWT